MLNQVNQLSLHQCISKKLATEILLIVIICCHCIYNCIKYYTLNLNYNYTIYNNTFFYSNTGRIEKTTKENGEENITCGKRC